MFGRDVSIEMAGEKIRRFLNSRWLWVSLGTLSAQSVNAQDDPQYRLEVGAGMGMVSYEGDFNASLFGSPQPIGTFLGRFNIDPYKAWRLGVSVGKLKGSSKHLDTYYPDYQEKVYSFNNTLVDMSMVFEYNFWPYGTGRDYRGAKCFTPYIYGGLGATYVSGGSKNIFTGNVPLGIGLKYKINERLNLGVDWTAHFSLSDELDGVKDPYGVKSSGAFKNTDCYTVLQVSLTYSFSAKCRTCNREE